MELGKRIRRKALRVYILFLLALYALGSTRFISRTDSARAEADLKTMILFVFLVIVVVISASIYFTITTPAGQAGLAGIGQSLAAAIASPFISIGDGIGSFFSSLFSGLGSAIGHLL